MLNVWLQHRVEAFDLDAAFETDHLITGVFGPSGAGKTTLLNLIAGLETPRTGSVAIDGQALFDSRRGINLPAHARRIGVVFQEHRLFPHYTVAGNLDYGLNLTAPGERRLSRSAIIDLLELGPLLERTIRTLSGGERQRIALGRALLASPRLLLLDEPLASLDHRLKEQILPFLRRVRDAAGVPMLYVSHSLTEIQRLTDRLLILDGGRLVGHGAIMDLVHEPSAGVFLRERADDLSNLLRLPVAASDDDLTVLALPGPASNTLRVSTRHVGGEMEVAIRPADIGLAFEPLHHSSIQNQLPGIVKRFSTFAGRTMVEVDIGLPLLAEVSHRSATTLGLREGVRLFCLIKSMAVRRLDDTTT